MAICWSLHSLIYVPVCYTVNEPYVNISHVYLIIIIFYYIWVQIKTYFCPLYNLFQELYFVHSNNVGEVGSAHIALKL